MNVQPEKFFPRMIIYLPSNKTMEKREKICFESKAIYFVK